MTLAFVKAEGLGNDFLVLDRRAAAPHELDALLARLAKEAPRLCDRRRGVGGDGILLVGSAPNADARMWVVNHDGSRPEMCGNGLRCVVAYLATHAPAARLAVETDAGVLACEVEPTDAGLFQVTVDMGPARDLGPLEPAAAAGRRFRGVSMGNPHAIHFVAPSEQPGELAAALGPAIEHDPLFPNRTNVEFAKITGPDRIELTVWERGCGLTLACGTGACATAAAAAWAGLVAPERPVEVQLPGGPLTIWAPAAPGGTVAMRGPARLVFEGQLTWNASETNS